MRRHFSTREAARNLGYSPQTLRNWRYLGIGPRYIRLNRCRVVYNESDLLRWIEGQDDGQSLVAPFGPEGAK